MRACLVLSDLSCDDADVLFRHDGAMSGARRAFDADAYVLSLGPPLFIHSAPVGTQAFFIATCVIHVLSTFEFS